MNEAKFLLQVIRNFINNSKNQLNTADFPDIDEEKLYKLAKSHKLSNFLINCEFKSQEIKNKVVTDFNNQIFKDTNENVEFADILEAFENSEIPLLVVKGFIMKDVYPQNYMRQMCDIDLMVKPDNFKNATKIMENMGYSKFYDHEKHLIFTKPPFITVELHRKLIPGEDTGYKYFNTQIWDFVVSYKDYKNIYQMTPEDAYVFCMLHLIIHFKYTGIQMRDILDVYLYLEKYSKNLDFEYINKKLEEFNLVQFEHNIKEISYKWFGNDETEDFDEVQAFIINGASVSNRVNYEIGNKGSKGKFLTQLFFPKYKVMKGKYPVLKKVPVLLPVMWVHRIFKDIFSKESTVKERLDTIKLIENAEDSDVSNVKEIYQKLGI